MSNFERIATEESDVIVLLASLCREVLQELSQYKSIDAEESRLSKILREEGKADG